VRDGRDHISLPALPLPVACFLIVPTGTPWYDLVVLAPRGERGEEPAVGVRRIGRDVAAHFLEVQRVDAVAGLLDLGEPALEAQEAHSAAFEALRPEARSRW
jgi:hypothetical protein